MVNCQLLNGQSSIGVASSRNLQEKSTFEKLTSLSGFTI
jgi:hypothetical protein